MRNKLIAAFFLVSSSLVLLSQNGVRASELSTSVGKPQIRIQIGSRRHDRGMHRGWYRGRRVAWYNYNRRDPQYVRQVYWVNGRQYVRWVRSY